MGAQTKKAHIRAGLLAHVDAGRCVPLFHPNMPISQKNYKELRENDRYRCFKRIL